MLERLTYINIKSHLFGGVTKFSRAYYCSFTVANNNYDNHECILQYCIDTTGLQPATTTVMELNGSITVTCTFATGASSTGCQVTIFMGDSLREVLSREVIRPHGASKASSMSQVSSHILLLPSVFSLSFPHPLLSQF